MENNYMEIKIAHLFCGSGLGALGFSLSKIENNGITAVFKNLGGIDNDPLCCKDFTYLTGAPAHCIDLFDRKQYKDFWGHEPPDNWHEIKGKEMKEIYGEYPDVVFLSPPCKGFSGLLPEKSSKSAKYQALNRLVIRSMQLAMDAWGDNPPAVILIENVPRIKTRGAKFISEVKALLGMYGYVFNMRDHECGEIGGLGQHRKRCLLIARNPKKAPSFIYQPPKHKLKSIGDVIGTLPMPGDTVRGGPMHRVPKLQWKTWLRLAIIPAGGDWRDLNRKCYANIYKVVPYNQPSSTVTGAFRPNNAALSVADPKLNYSCRAGTFKLIKWDEPAPTVTCSCGAGRSNGISGVSDPRVADWPGKHSNKYKVEAFDKPSGTVIGATDIQSGAQSIADPRGSQYSNNYKINRWNEPAHTVIGSRVGSGASLVGDPRNYYHGAYKITPYEELAGAVTSAHGPTCSGGAAAVADPRIKCNSRPNLFGVSAWDKPASTVTGSASVTSSNGVAAVQDTRYNEYSNAKGENEVPEPSKSGVWIIISEDGTWHRPLTTLELAALQGLPILHNGKPLKLAGNSEAVWREHIGNGVPVQTAAAIGNAILDTLLPNFMGEWHWNYENSGVWVKGYRNINELELINKI